MNRAESLNDLKRDVFMRLVGLAGRAFIHVRDSGGTKLGRRGFLGDEAQNGIVLVLNRRMNFSWEEDLLIAKLVFGSTTEKCVIHANDIMAVYSPDIGVQLVVEPQSAEPEDGGHAWLERPHVQKPAPLPKKSAGRKKRGRAARKTDSEQKGRIIKVDFNPKDKG